MTSRRLIFAHLLIAAVVGGSLYDIVKSQEHWPFSDYPMFSTIHRRHVLENWYRVFGVTPDGEEVAILAYPELWPLDQSRLPLGIRRLAQQPGNETKVHAALTDILRRYEERRIAGRHDGPAFRGLRLYSLAWDLEPNAANLDRPRSRMLIAEVGQLAGARQ
jgi:hypothetical protein